MLLLLTLMLCYIYRQTILENDTSGAKNAYVFYANDDQYACSVLVNVHILQHIIATKYRIFVIISDGVSPAMENTLLTKKITIVKETPLPLHENSVPYYKGCLLKLAAFKLHEFDSSIRRLLVLDADQLILQDLDGIFDIQMTDFMAPTAYWIDNRTISSTCMLIQPNPQLWEKVMAAATTIGSDRYDMDLLNDLFAGRRDRLNERYATLNSHWEDWNVPSWMDFTAFAHAHLDHTLTSDRQLRTLYDQAAIIHFTAVGKPWMYDIEELQKLRPEAHPIMVEQWIRWRSLALQNCPDGMLSHI
jgi:lipopolysaccharide biosynthesis glycosyltransferase